MLSRTKMCVLTCSLFFFVFAFRFCFSFLFFFWIPWASCTRPIRHTYPLVTTQCSTNVPVQWLLTRLEHLLVAATTPADAILYVVAIYLSSEESIYKAVFWRRLRMLEQQSSLPDLQRHAHEGYCRCNARPVDISLVFTGEVVRTKPRQKRQILGYADAKDCPLYAQNGTKDFIRHLHKGHEAQWKLVLAAYY